MILRAANTLGQFQSIYFYHLPYSSFIRCYKLKGYSQLLSDCTDRNTLCVLNTGSTSATESHLQNNHKKKLTPPSLTGKGSTDVPTVSITTDCKLMQQMSHPSMTLAHIWHTSVIIIIIIYTYVVSYLLLLHRLFVRFLHLVHLHSHIGLLVLEVCFELCELEGNLITNTSNKYEQQTVMQL